MDNQADKLQTTLNGTRVRALRRQRHMSIKDFAQAAGISAGYASQLERNLIEPSLAVTRRICAVLEVTLTSLLNNSGDLHLVRKGEGQLIFPDCNSVYSMRAPSVLSSGRLPHLSVAVIVQLAGFMWDHAEPVTHEGDEYVYVLHGRIEYHTAQGAVAASTGDSLYIKADTAHRVYNPLPEEASMLAIY